MRWELLNATLITPHEILHKASLGVEGSTISHVGRKRSYEIEMDVSELLVFPGFINGHDHLLGSYLPRVGDRRPYLNWLEWDNDLKSSPIYRERQQIESRDLYLLGAFRHLICGVTSVQDHIPHFVREAFGKNLPIRLVDRYAVEHSVTSFSLKWGEGIEKEHKKAQEGNMPFIIHCSEGFDEETLLSVKTLEEKGALSSHTVLIHGIAFSDEDIKKIREKGASVVWCPVSNLYMFDTTLRIKEVLDAGINVLLGTDSPMSGGVNMFEEIYIAREYYFFRYKEELPEKTILEMLTTNAAKAFFLEDRGELKEGKLADFVLIDGDPSDPYKVLGELDYEKVMLVVIDGIPRYGDIHFKPLFEALGIPFYEIRVQGARKIIKDPVLEVLDRVYKAVGYKKELAFLPVEPV